MFGAATTANIVKLLKEIRDELKTLNENLAKKG